MSKKMLADIMRQAQKLQEEMLRVQKDAESKTIEASAGGGMVTAVANGAGQIVSIKIDPEVVNPEDVQMLEDLVVAACNEALKRAKEMVQEELSKLTGGMPLPGIEDLGRLFGA